MVENFVYIKPSLLFSEIHKDDEKKIRSSWQLRKQEFIRQIPVKKTALDVLA